MTLKLSIVRRARIDKAYDRMYPHVDQFCTAISMSAIMANSSDSSITLRKIKFQYKTPFNLREIRIAILETLPKPFRIIEMKTRQIIVHIMMKMTPQLTKKFCCSYVHQHAIIISLLGSLSTFVSPFLSIFKSKFFKRTTTVCLLSRKEEEKSVKFSNS